MNRVKKFVTAMVLALISLLLPVTQVSVYAEPTSPSSDPAHNASAGITVTAGTGTYAISRQNPVTGEPVIVNEPYDEGGEIYINDTMWDHNANLEYDVAPGDTTVNFTFETFWNERFYDDIIINDVPYMVADYLDFDDRDEWLLANHGTQLIAFTIPGVAKADNYNVVVKHGENNGTRWNATFLWTADPAQAGGFDYIGHSTLEFVKAEYTVASTNYVVTEDDIATDVTRDGGRYVFNSPDGYMSYMRLADVNYDDGGVTLPGGAKVTMRVVPEYGYQVTSVNGGSDFATTDADVSEFTVTVGNGEAGYFQAEVTFIGDEVTANSEKVTSGTVVIADGEFDSGTVQLTVDDVELNQDKTNDFEEAAGNYQIKSYLDINLSKVLYKGSEDSTDIWEEQVHHLSNKALVSLQLEDGIDGNDIVIVHNIDDGDEYEVIEIESYDPTTNTITFWTDSFSNYAIAARTVVSPDTGYMSKKAEVISCVESSFSVATVFVATVIVASAWLVFRTNKK